MERFGVKGLTGMGAFARRGDGASLMLAVDRGGAAQRALSPAVAALVVAAGVAFSAGATSTRCA